MTYAPDFIPPSEGIETQEGFGMDVSFLALASWDSCIVAVSLIFFGLEYIGMVQNSSRDKKLNHDR